MKVVQFIPQERCQDQQLVHIDVFLAKEEIATVVWEVVRLVSQERVQQRTPELFVGAPVLQILDETRRDGIGSPTGTRAATDRRANCGGVFSINCGGHCRRVFGKDLVTDRRRSRSTSSRAGNHERI